MKSLSFLFLLLLLNSFLYNASAQLTSTNLPIVIITTPTAIATTQIQGTISIIDNASGINTPTDFPKFSGMIGVNTRGNTTYPKSSYGVETWSASTVSIDTALLGMPSDNDWVLIPSYEDRSFLRNTLSYKLHDMMGRYVSRQKYCEVIVNTQYMGIYTFGEKIKRDSLRLDIAKLTTTDNSGINLTGGYIINIDGNGNGWTSAFAPPYATAQTIHFEYEYPKSSEITPVQQSYIKSYVDSFEAELNGANFQDTLIGWRRHGAENSFIDFMIMQEISRNNEAYRKNTFLYKDKGTKLRPGPLWSFETAWENTLNCNSSQDTGWCYNLGGVCGTESKLAPFWWQKLATDALFVEDLKCRYTNYRKVGEILDTVKIFQFIDSVNTYLNANGAIARNFIKWPIWGVPIVNEPTPMATNYAEEIINLKQFIKARLTWLDTKWITSSTTCGPLKVSTNLLDKDVTIFPNPAADNLNISIKDNANEKYVISLYSLLGTKLHSYSTHFKNSQIDISLLSKGIYYVTISSSKGKVTKKIVKE